jgi:sugar lactone lactonase YvrE
MKPTFWILLALIGLLLTSCGPQAPQVTTLAGDGRGFADGKGEAAQFDSPLDVTADEKGNVYVADSANHRVRLIAPSGAVTTLAGSAEVGDADGVGSAARFSSITGIALAPSGVVFLADSVEMDPHPMRVRALTPAGEVSTLAGGTEAGYTDGKGSAAFFRTPANLTIDKDGNIYVADTNNHRIRLVKADGAVSTFAGPVGSGYAAGYKDGMASEAKFNSPRGVAVDAAGNLYVVDTGNHCIRKITPDGQVTTLAGSKEAGYADGVGAEARFNFPADIAVDAQGNLYVADTANHRIRKITPEGVVSTLAGSGQAGFADGAADAAQFRAPEGIAVDARGNVYVADTGNNRIRKIIVP